MRHKEKQCRLQVYYLVLLSLCFPPQYSVLISWVLLALRMMLYLFDVRQVRPANAEDYIHAKPQQISRLFLMASETNHGSHSAKADPLTALNRLSDSSMSSSTPMRTLKGVGLAVEDVHSYLLKSLPLSSHVRFFPPCGRRPSPCSLGRSYARR